MMFFVFLKRKLHLIKLWMIDLIPMLLFRIYGCCGIKRKKLVFSNHNGKRFGDSPYSIFLYLQKKHPDWDFVWLSDNNYEHRTPNGSRTVPYGKKSKKMLYELATAGVWINSHYIFTYTRPVKKQLFIQTWHGGIALKSDKLFDTIDNKIHAKKRFISFENADYVLSDSDFTSKNFIENFSTGTLDNLLKIGSPCDDIFFKNTNTTFIKNKLNLPNDKKNILYCPTYRATGNIDCYKLDVQKVINAFRKMLKCDCVLAIRLHPVVMKENKDLFHADNKIVFDVTDYEFINDILCVADVLITDYSGVMGTFMNTSRPIFLYQTDYLDYKKERYISFDDKDLPFCVARHSEDLIKCIENFDINDFNMKLAVFKQKLGFVENMHATERICNIIEEFVINGKK